MQFRLCYICYLLWKEYVVVIQYPFSRCKVVLCILQYLICKEVTCKSSHWKSFICMPYSRCNACMMEWHFCLILSLKLKLLTMRGRHFILFWDTDNLIKPYNRVDALTSGKSPGFCDLVIIQPQLIW